MNRNFGVELEMVGIDQANAAAAIRSAGIECNVEGYNHQTRPQWKVVTDGSLRDETGRGSCEVVSPVLFGQDGLDQVTKVCNALIAAGAKINKTCGLHVHVDARDLSTSAVKAIIARYTKFEAQIDAFMAPSRRQAFYAQSMSQDMARILRCNTVNDMAQAMLSKYSGQARYRKVNVMSYLRHGTLEFRQHGGSVEAEKICNWVRFLQSFVETSATVTFPTEKKYRGAVASIYNAIRSNPEASQDQIELMVAAQHPEARRAHLRAAYRNIMAEASSGASDTLYAGISQDIEAYYNRRTLELASN